MEIERLVTVARESMARAHAPYSGFRVGAAVLGEDGSVHTGCNVENASYGLTLCAERTAVAKAVSEGVRRFRCIVVVTGATDPAPPCGACLQVLAEFSPDMTVVTVGEATRQEWSLLELLPAPFRS